MVRIVHNLTLRPLNIARHLIPDIVWKLINFPLIISATLNVDHVSFKFGRGGQCVTYRAAPKAGGPHCGRACETLRHCCPAAARAMLSQLLW